MHEKGIQLNTINSKMYIITLKYEQFLNLTVFAHHRPIVGRRGMTNQRVKLRPMAGGIAWWRANGSAAASRAARARARGLCGVSRGEARAQVGQAAALSPRRCPQDHRHPHHPACPPPAATALAPGKETWSTLFKCDLGLDAYD